MWFCMTCIIVVMYKSKVPVRQIKNSESALYLHYHPQIHCWTKASILNHCTNHLLYSASKLFCLIFTLAASCIQSVCLSNSSGICSQCYTYSYFYVQYLCSPSFGLSFIPVGILWWYSKYRLWHPVYHAIFQWRFIDNVHV